MNEAVKPRVPMLVWQTLLGVAFLGAWQELVNAGKLDKFFFKYSCSLSKTK